MWIDERGAEVANVPEGRRPLALGAKEPRHGHLVVPAAVVPAEPAIYDEDVIVRAGDGMFARLVGDLVSLKVDGAIPAGGQTGTGGERQWSTLRRGLGIQEDEASFGGGLGPVLDSAANPAQLRT